MVKPKIKNETRYEKFKRLAENRTKKILKDLKILGNCSNKILYDYNESDINKIFKAIETELKRVKSLFFRIKSNDFSLG